MMEQTKQNGWKTLLSKDFILVLAISCFNQFATMATKTPINQFGRELGIAATLLGLIATIQGIWKMVCRPIWGPINDSMNKKVAMTVALIVQLATYVIYAFTDSFAMFIIGRFVEGVSFAIVGTSVYAALGFVVDRRALGTAMGFYATFPKLVQAFAPTVSMSLYTNHGARYAFLVSAGCITVSIVLTQFLTFKNVNAPAPKAESAQPKQRKKLGDIISIKGLLFFPMILGDGFQNGVLDLVVIVYATSLGIPEAGALFFSVQQFVTIFLAVPFGFIQDKFGGKVSVIFSYLCRAAGCFLIAVNPTHLFFVLAGVLCGTAKPGNNVLQTEAMKLQPKQRFGIAASTHLLLVDLGVMIGSGIGGLLVDNAGFSVCFAVSGAILVAGAVLYLVMQPIIQKAIDEAAVAETN